MDHEEHAGDEIAPPPSTIESIESALLGGPRALTLADLAAAADVDQDQARLFWRTLGFPNVSADEPVFTADDARALSRITGLIRDGHLDLRTAVSITRALGHTTDRLVLWQVEALVEDAVRRQSLDDTTARLLVLDRLAELGPVLEAQLVHSWRRQLAALAGRFAAEFGQVRQRPGDEDALPLWRAVGFADMVSFTKHTAGLGSHELAEFVQRFETIARDVVTSGGGRVVKTIGDAVLYVADDVQIGAEVALGLAQEIGAQRSVPPVRVSLVWGRVLSRFGDVFGPSVNMAARLTAIAAPATVLMDGATARRLDQDVRFTLIEQGEREVPGLGPITPVLLQWRHGPGDVGP